MAQMTVSDVARLIGTETGSEVKPRDISQLFYDRKLREDLAPISNGRRLIQPELVEVIKMQLRRSGKLPAIKQEAAHA